MNGYSKIRFVRARHSRSMDFSDLPQHPSLIQTPKPITPDQIPNIPSQEEIKKPMTRVHSSSDQKEEEEEKEGTNNGERFGAILHRNGSISSSSSHRFHKFERQRSGREGGGRGGGGGLSCAVKRAFSMRRSSSVSERYCRIYDQFLSMASPIHDHDDDDDGDDDGMGMVEDVEKMQPRSEKKKHKRGKILKACKRLLGF